MIENNNSNNEVGSIDAIDRVMQELLNTPKFKEGVKIILKSIDPRSVPGLVRTLMWQDSELFLAAAGVIPDVVNGAILGGNELVKQTDKLPPPLLAEFLAAFLSKLDGEALGELISDFIELYRVTGDLKNDALKDAAADFRDSFKEGLGKDGGGAYAALLSLLKPVIKEKVASLAKEAKEENSDTALFIKGLSETIGEAVNDNPDFITFVMDPLAGAFKGKVEAKEEPAPGKKAVNKAAAKKAPAKKPAAKTSAQKKKTTAKKGAKKS